MSDKTMLTEQTPPTTEPTTPLPKPKKKRNKKKTIKTIITLAIIVIVIAVGAFLLWKFVFAPKEEQKGEPILDTASMSSISTTVEGNGTAKASNSSTITLTAAGTVTGVYVTEGQQVKAGDPLYTITSPAAEDAAAKAKDAVTAAQQSVVDAQDALADCQTALQKKNTELNDIYKDQATAADNRTVTAAFSGQLRDAVTYLAGDAVAKGTQVAKLVDDSKFRLSLYFNYAYEGQIYVGQTATVSIPSYMTTLSGTVEEINMVRRVSAEGSTLFEAVVVFNNPGALTDGLTATAVLGTNIYPYDSGTTTYYRTAAVVTKAAGEVETTNLKSYEDVTAGQSLLVLTAEDFTDQLTAKQDEITEAQKAITSAEKAVEDAQNGVTEAQQAADKALAALDDFNAVSPIDGTVISCSLIAGEDVESGRVAISIADTSVMNVSIDVDERNISYISNGMSINLQDWNSNAFSGTVEAVSLEASTESTVTTFPVTVTVDNSNGLLLSGTTLYYSFVANQSENCIVLPVEDVRYVNTDTGETSTVVFVQRDARPDNAIDLPQDSTEQCPEGFYAVPVTIGISDDYNVEMIDGVQEGDVVFNSYATTATDTSGAVMYG